MGEPEALLPPPLLLTSHYYQSELHSVYNLLDDRYRTTSIPILRNKSVICSAYGWLVLLDCTDGDAQGQCCLWNPTSFEVIQLLLVLKDPCVYNRCFLSKPPTDPDCFLLFNHLFSLDQTVYRIQDHAYFRLDLFKRGYRLLSMVSFREMIYGIMQPVNQSKYEFVTIHMVGDKFETKPLLIDDKLTLEVPQPIRSWTAFNMDYLIESPCGNELLYVNKLSFHNKVESAFHFRVFRVDVRRMVCEELDNLDGRTLFISHDGNGFCRSSESFGAAIKPNSIYYTNRVGMVMYVYDMDDRSTVTLLPCPGADIDPDTSESVWVDISP